jgi:hypothetical protein
MSDREESPGEGTPYGPDIRQPRWFYSATTEASFNTALSADIARIIGAALQEQDTIRERREERRHQELLAALGRLNVQPTDNRLDVASTRQTPPPLPTQRQIPTDPLREQYISPAPPNVLPQRVSHSPSPPSQNPQHQVNMPYNHMQNTPLNNPDQTLHPAHTTFREYTPAYTVASDAPAAALAAGRAYSEKPAKYKGTPKENVLLWFRLLEIHFGNHGIQDEGKKADVMVGFLDGIAQSFYWSLIQKNNGHSIPYTPLREKFIKRFEDVISRSHLLRQMLSQVPYNGPEKLM